MKWCSPPISSHRVVVTVVELLISKQQRVSDEDEDGSQDEGDEQLDMDVVPGAVQLPEEMTTSHTHYTLLYTYSVFRCRFKHDADEGPVSDWIIMRSFLRKQAEYGDGDGERDEGESVSSCVHGLHVGEVQMGI